ncbi:MAG: patatin-like phospholipase family protein [Acidobacteria bacterium]|nr:patatin-like phospholipase family protein [Acidobacteriota bacterium]
MKAAKIWALVLMGGGARGLAHIGVIRVLEREGLLPDVVAGTSMGGLVGGLYAAGVSPDRMTEMIGGLDLGGLADEGGRKRLFPRPRNLFEYILLSDTKNRFFTKIGLDKEDAVEAYLKGCVGDVRIEDLPVKFLCNAVDLASGREIVFTKGKLTRALRATMSLPIVFEPVRLDRMVLMDGGILNSAPVEAAKAAGAEVAVLVDIHRPLKRLPREKLKSAFQIVQRTVEVATAASFAERARHADFVLRVPVDQGVLQFSKPRAIVAKGERVAAAGLAALKKAIGARR